MFSLNSPYERRRPMAAAAFRHAAFGLRLWRRAAGWRYNGRHPFHGFSMMSCGHLAEEHTSAIYIVDAREPGIARGMGLKTRATFEEALEDAKKKYVGYEPNILALP